MDDGRGGAEDEPLELGVVHHAGLRLEPGGNSRTLAVMIR